MPHAMEVIAAENPLEPELLPGISQTVFPFASHIAN